MTKLDDYNKSTEDLYKDSVNHWFIYSSRLPWVVKLEFFLRKYKLVSGGIAATIVYLAYLAKDIIIYWISHKCS